MRSGFSIKKGSASACRRRDGFTLIELLVVVAIIGLLSSVVLASLNSARAKAKDAAIKAEINQLATMMSLNYDDYGSYCQLQAGWITASTGGIACNNAFSGTYASQTRQICNAIYNNANADPGYRMYTGVTSLGCATTWTFMVPLNNGNWYCLGSSGRKGEYGYYGDPPSSNPGCYGNP